MALGLDQTPKSLLPAITCRWVLPITVVNNFLVTGQPNPIQPGPGRRSRARRHKWSWSGQIKAAHLAK